MMQLTELFSAAGLPTPVSSKGQSAAGEVTAVTADSRQAGPGVLFVAIAGERVDGHDYIAEAVARGCRLILSQRGRRLNKKRLDDASDEPVVWLQAADTREALGLLCAAFWDHPARSLVMIGITAHQAAKTTCAYLLEALLAFQGAVPGVDRHRQLPLPRAGSGGGAYHPGAGNPAALASRNAA
ncbi:MAG: Mur ligase domain-containing protein, partial [Desulfurivibrio sp.]|nr:Mur ligase domain-containing protein [Desulfurivibrio sp.]